MASEGEGGEIGNREGQEERVKIPFHKKETRRHIVDIQVTYTW